MQNCLSGRFITALIGAFALSLGMGLFSVSVAQNDRQLVVTSAQDVGPGTFRSAIEDANESDELTRITFSSEVREQGIDILSDLPAIEAPMSIIGSDDDAAHLDIRFAEVHAVTDGLVIQASDVMIRGLHLSGYQNSGIVIQGANNVSVISNLIGGEPRFPSQTGSGIVINTSENALIDGNEISGHLESGIEVSNVSGCPSAAEDGDSMLRTAEQVEISYDCHEKAIQVETFGHHRFVRNLIGMIAAEGWRSGNKGIGILVDHSSNNVIGGSAGMGNVVANNGLYGIMISGQRSTANAIQGNMVGTDDTGLVAKPNGRSGVLIYNSGGNTVGGKLHDTGNLISGNKRQGVNLDGSATRPAFDSAFGGCGFTQSNAVLGNLIGTDITGAAPLPNGKHGIFVFQAGNNQIGGDDRSEGNVISSNAENGVFVVGPNPKTVDWRYFVRIPDTREELKTNIRCVGEKKSNEVILNRIVGNTIGMSADRQTFLPNGRNAITFSNSFENEVIDNHLASVKKRTITSGKRDGQKDNILTGNIDYFQSNEK